MIYGFIREHSNEFAVESYHYNKKRIERLMKEIGLKAIQKRKFKRTLRFFITEFVYIHPWTIKVRKNTKTREIYLNYVSNLMGEPQFIGGIDLEKNIAWYMDKKIERTIEGLKKRNMEGYCVNDEVELIELLTKLIPQNSVVGVGGFHDTF